MISFLSLAWVNELSGSILKLLSAGHCQSDPGLLYLFFGSVNAAGAFFLLTVVPVGACCSIKTRAIWLLARVADSQSHQLCEFCHFGTWKLLKLRFFVFPYLLLLLGVCWTFVWLVVTFILQLFSYFYRFCIPALEYLVALHVEPSVGPCGLIIQSACWLFSALI